MIETLRTHPALSNRPPPTSSQPMRRQMTAQAKPSTGTKMPTWTTPRHRRPTATRIRAPPLAPAPPRTQPHQPRQRPATRTPMPTRATPTMQTVVNPCAEDPLARDQVQGAHPASDPGADASAQRALAADRRLEEPHAPRPIPPTTTPPLPQPRRIPHRRTPRRRPAARPLPKATPQTPPPPWRARPAVGLHSPVRRHGRSRRAHTATPVATDTAPSEPAQTQRMAADQSGAPTPLPPRNHQRAAHVPAALPPHPRMTDGKAHAQTATSTWAPRRDSSATDVDAPSDGPSALHATKADPPNHCDAPGTAGVTQPVRHREHQPHCRRT